LTRRRTTHQGGRGSLLHYTFKMDPLFWVWTVLNVILMFSEEESNDCSTNNQEEDSGSRDGSPEEEARLQRILAKHFQSRRFMMRLSKAEISQQSLAPDKNQEDDNANTEIKISCKETGRDQTLASSGCAICLEPYQVNDIVVWSSNTKCSHIFHRSCLVAYFAAQKDGKSPCPCCRQNFLKTLVRPGLKTA